MKSPTNLIARLPWLLLPAALLLAGCLLLEEPEAPAEAPTGPPPASEQFTPTPVPTSGASAASPAGSSSGSPAGASSQPSRSGPRQYAAPPPMTIDPSRSYTATIATNRGEMQVALYPADAPVTVNNFVFLAREGFYNGVAFHRIIKGFMVQTGDPTGTGAGGPGYRFADEPIGRNYTKGIVAMANAGPNTNGSQFFIVHADDAGLPPNYTIFGEVVSGIGTLDAIANTPVRAARSGEVSVPTESVVIDSVRISEDGA